ncbi:MAG: hypothetical protein VW934_06140, partial [Alphaproteobacteria bacterium]
STPPLAEPDPDEEVLAVSFAAVAPEVPDAPEVPVVFVDAEVPAPFVEAVVADSVPAPSVSPSVPLLGMPPAKALAEAAANEQTITYFNSRRMKMLLN